MRNRRNTDIGGVPTPYAVQYFVFVLTVEAINDNIYLQLYDPLTFEFIDPAIFDGMPVESMAPFLMTALHREDVPESFSVGGSDFILHYPTGSMTEFVNLRVKAWDGRFRGPNGEWLAPMISPPP